MGRSLAERRTAAEALHVDSGNFHRVLSAAKEFDAALYAGLRRELRDAAKPLVEDIQANIRLIPSSGRTRWGMRDALAKGTRASIVSGGKTGRMAGIRIVTKPKPVPYATKSGAKLHTFPTAAFNTKSGRFRHPVFGADRWVEQAGRPYFGSVIYGHRQQVAERIAAVLAEAAAQMSIELEGSG